jgi:hypothetical protein
LKLSYTRIVISKKILFSGNWGLELMDETCGGRETYERRTVLKTMGVAGATALGASAGSQPAAAGDLIGSDDCDYPDPLPTAIDTADHTHIDGMNAELTEGNTATNYDIAGGSLPDAPDEIVIHVHGFWSNRPCGFQSVNTVKAAYDEQDYDTTVTGLVWDSDYLNWWECKDIAVLNAPKLANFLTDFKDQNPDTTIRVQGHSLGGRVLAETILELDKQNEYDVITSAIFMGAAIAEDSVAIHGKYGGAIENVVQHAENFWMDDDKVLDWAYGIAESPGAVGSNGCSGTPPANYTDHRVYLASHFVYYKPGKGVTGLAIDTFEKEEPGDNTLSGSESNYTDDWDWREDTSDPGGGGGPGFTLPAVGAALGGSALIKRFRGDE